MPLRDVAKVLFEHEARWWRTTAAQERWALGPVTEVLLTRVMAVLALFSPADEQVAAGVLRRIPELADAPAERIANLTRWAYALYPGTEGVRIGPDLLVDWFITTTLTRTDSDREFTRHLLAGLDEGQAARVLTVLARAGEHYSPARQLFEQLLGDDPVRLAYHAIYAALVTTHRRDLDHTTAAVLANVDLAADTTLQLLEFLPVRALPHTALALARRHLHHTRTAGNPVDLARALGRLRAALGWLGQRTEQIQVARESVALYRQVVVDDPHLPARSRQRPGRPRGQIGSPRPAH